MKPAAQTTPHEGALDSSLLACLLGTLILRAAAAAMGVMIQFYFEYINQNVYPISNTAGGIIIGTFFAAELIGAPLFGAWSDRYGRKPFIIMGPLFGAIAVQITAMSTILWVLLITRLLEGLSTAANAPATLGYLSAATTRSKQLRGRAVSLFEVATIGGMAGGLWLGGLLWEEWGAPLSAGILHLTSPAFSVDGLIYLLSLVVFAIGLREAHTDLEARAAVRSGAHAVQAVWRRYLRIATSRRVVRFIPAWLGVNAVLGVWLNHVARQLTRPPVFPGQILTGGFSEGDAGAMFAVFALIFAAGILAWGMRLGQMSKSTVMLIGTGGLLLSVLSIVLLNHLPSLHSSLAAPLALLFVVSLLLMSGFTPAALAYLADITEDHVADRGAIMGLYSVLLGVGQFAGAALGGPFADWQAMDGLALLSGVLGALSAGAILHLKRVEAE